MPHTMIKLLLLLACAGMRHGISHEAWFCDRPASEVCGLLCPAQLCSVLGVLPRHADHADQRLRQRMHALSEVVLGLFDACRHGGGNGNHRFRQLSHWKCGFLRVDQHRKSLDVWRAAGNDEKSAINVGEERWTGEREKDYGLCCGW